MAISLEAPRIQAFGFDPSDLVIALPKSDPLHDPRTETVPVTRDDVLNAIVRPLPPIEVRRRGDDSLVIDGKQRTKAALVANAIGARIAYRGPVEAVKLAIGEFMSDLEFVAKVREIMSAKPIRLRAVAFNSGDETDARLAMRARNYVGHGDPLTEKIRWAVEEAEKYGTPPDRIALAAAVSITTVKRWLAQGASGRPDKRRGRGKAVGPSKKRLGAIHDELEAAGDGARDLAVLFGWLRGLKTDAELLEQWPDLTPSLQPKKTKKAA